MSVKYEITVGHAGEKSEQVEQFMEAAYELVMATLCAFDVPDPYVDMRRSEEAS